MAAAVSEFTPETIDPQFQKTTKDINKHPTKLAQSVLSLLVIFATDCNIFLASANETIMWITYQLNEDLTILPTSYASFSRMGPGMTYDEEVW